MITVEYFGKLKLLTEVGREAFEVVSTVNDLKKIIHRKYPDFTNEDYMTMVNNKFVKDDYQLSEGDEVTLLSVVDGG